MNQLKSISKGTWARTVLIILALVNQGLTLANKNPLPFSDQELENFVSYAFTSISALIAWWKNNSFTANAKTAQDILKAQKFADKEAKKFEKLNKVQEDSAKAFVDYPEKAENDNVVG